MLEGFQKHFDWRVELSLPVTERLRSIVIRETWSNANYNVDFYYIPGIKLIISECENAKP